jgi:hypothetical protein
LGLNDTDLGCEGGEVIGIALAQNSTLRSLNVSQNDLKSSGAIQILSNARCLENLAIANCQLKSDCGMAIQQLLKKSKRLIRLQLEYNELMTPGAEAIA